MQYSLLNCRHGLFLSEDNDMISAILRLYGEWAEHSFLLLKPLIPKGGCVVDVGANVGCLSIPFARCVGPEGVVLALEPQRRVFYNLCANLLINELFWVRAQHCLIGAQPGTAQVSLHAMDSVSRPWLNRGSTSFVEALQNRGAALDGAERLPIHTLDSLLADQPSCDLVKVDVEGAEPHVLRGMIETLRGKRPFLYLECGSEGLHAQLMPMLAAVQYKPFWHPCPHFRPGNFRQSGNRTGSKGDMNILCVPREKLGSDQARIWQGLHPARDWASIASLFPGFRF